MTNLFHFLKNKYFLVSVGFIAWIFFFAEYDILSQFRQRNELKEMKAKIQYLENEVANLRAEKEAVKTDSNTLVKYAREKYFMKSPNEDVFVFDTINEVPATAK
jgi:cell division protein DivIC